MGCRDGVRLARSARRVHTPGVADPGVDPGLVVRDPESNAITEASRDYLRVLGEGLGGPAGRPAAQILEGLRRVPVEQRRVRLDVMREQLVDETVVEIQP